MDDEDEAPKSGGRKKDNTSRKKQGRRKKEAKKQKTVTVSTTDPECRLFHKGEHKRCFAYEAHTACDKNGYVLAAVVTLGNVHDSVAFDDVYDKLLQSFPEAETIVADAAYKTPHIYRKVFRDGRVLSTAYKRPQTMKGGHPVAFSHEPPGPRSLPPAVLPGIVLLLPVLPASFSSSDLRWL